MVNVSSSASLVFAQASFTDTFANTFADGPPMHGA
jgi:hypothetical protein